MARWGMPGPPQYGGQPVTNIRNVASPHWRGWLGRRNRCIVPATSLYEYADTKPRKTPIWFALAEDRPLFAFAGLWTRWRGVRGSKSAPVVDGAASSRLPALPHSITSSAAASTVGGISMPSTLAVVRLTLISNFVACSIGRSPGFAPLRILSTKVAARRNIGATSTP